MAGPTLYRPSNIPSGLQGYWKLDEASGDRSDSSPNGNTLTDVNSVTSQAYDYWNTSGTNCAQFTSANSEYLVRTDAAQTGLDINGANAKISISAWIKRDTAASNGNIVNKGNGTDDKFYRFRVGSDDLLWFEIRNTPAAAGFVSSAISIPAGKWTHVAGVSDGTNLSVYIDGNLSATILFSSGIGDTPDDFLLGAGCTVSGCGTKTTFFNGKMKDVAVWNVALTPLQIKSLAMGVDLSAKSYRPNRTAASPTAYWKMNEISSGAGAVSRADSSGNGHTLTDNNTVASLGGLIEGTGADLIRANSEYFTVADHADWDITGDFTIASWIRFTSITGFGLMEHRADNDNLWRFVRDGSTLELRMRTGGTPTQLVGLSWTPKVDTWYHLVLKHSGTVYTIYIDGISVATNTTATNPPDVAGTLTIGYTPSNAENLNGRLSDVALWKGYALTDTEITKLASAFPIQQTGIVSYWKLDEAGTPASYADTIGPNTLTTSGSPPAVVGQVSNAGDFEAGSNQYASIANGSQTGLDITIGQYTFSCWVKPETLPGSLMTLIDKSQGGSDAYWFVIRTTNVLQCYHQGNTFTGTNTLTAGVWQYVTFSHEGAGGNVRFYIDGWNESSVTSTHNPNTNTHDVWMAQTSGGGQNYDGIMDEVIFAQRFFRPEEVKSVYIKGLGGLSIQSDPSPSNKGGFFALL